jgi:hypothetical protein
MPGLSGGRAPPGNSGHLLRVAGLLGAWRPHCMPAETRCVRPLRPRTALEPDVGEIVLVGLLGKADEAAQPLNARAAFNRIFFFRFRRAVASLKSACRPTSRPDAASHDRSKSGLRHAMQRFLSHRPA